ncbi:MAG: hypothetical protein R6U91_07590 [Bacillota bacterium]
MAKKEQPKTLKRQRWAAVVAAILAFGMIVSAVGAYLSQGLGQEGSVLPDQQEDPEPEDYLAYYEDEVERLENYLDEHESSPVILRELAENYQFLVFIKQVYFDDQEAVREYRERMVSIYESLIEKEPDMPEHRYELINLYVELQEEDELIEEELTVLLDTLHENPDPRIHMSLIETLAVIEKEEKITEEVNWLQNHLEQKVAEGVADNEERYIYAVLLGEYLEDSDKAEIILEDILEEEEGDTRIYQAARQYLSFLEEDEDYDEDDVLID